MAQAALENRSWLNVGAVNPILVEASLGRLSITARGSCEERAKTLEAHFRRTTAKDDLLKCERCGGLSDAKLDACPFCGEAGVTPPEPSETPAEHPPVPEAARIGRLLRERLEDVDGAPRVATGIQALDELMGGGLRSRRILVIGGAPEAGKTTLVTQVALTLARSGVAVAIVERCQEPETIDTRLLMSIGISRAAAETPSAATIDRAEKDLGKLSLYIVEEDDVSTDEVLSRLRKAHPTGEIAVVIDSLQVIADTEGEGESKRGRIESYMSAFKSTVREHDAIGIAVCEVARDVYRSKRSAAEVNALAAFKESGDIEYSTDVAALMRNVAGDVVEVEVAKNRLGQKGTFRLRLDRDRATFGAEEVSTEAADAALDERLVGIIEANPGRSGSQLARLASAKKEAVFSSLERLVERGSIHNGGSVPRPKWSPGAEAKEASQ